VTISIVKYNQTTVWRQHHDQYPPTVREIGAGVGLSSSSTVHIVLFNCVG